MKITDTSDLWWKTAVVYCLDVETFLDWDGDGTGDVAGLVQRLDYLAELGVTCLWLMPFYPTPDRDDGYDITDFYGVDPRLGNHGDIVELFRTANDRGIRVIVDLVVNHTSDRHPWFRSARASRSSRYRDWYVWSDDPPPTKPSDIVFPDQETSIWQWDDKAGQHYLHRFYRHQPDLNVSNPAVRDEIAKVMGFWLSLGVSGFRVDAVPFFIETAQLHDESLPDPHTYLKTLRAFLSRRQGDAIMLGEVNLAHDQQYEFVGGDDGDELTMLFDFITMQRLYLALARADAEPLVEALRDRPELPRHCQWATFVRNHDELTLDKLDDDERAEVFAAFGPDPDMQIYGRGLRRRLPPMLDGDPRRIRMVYSLLFSLPGTPVLFYGEEIGMGEELSAEGRSAVRTAMQWNTHRNGGFSEAAPSRLAAPVVEGAFGPEHVNVEAQRRDPSSLLRFVTLLAQRYREAPELGWGAMEVLDQPHRSVLAHRTSHDGASTIAVHNLGAEACTVPLQLADEPEGTRLVDQLCDGATELDARGRVELELEGYGFRWLRVVNPGDRRLT
ncbi:trehalose synthase [Iamia sp. SCSIO 61187]|uniref:alpha-amylase family protein n=1 Tax=Iamia sp. SCSIO 61187 TaxID=2722752 RepID=UPI001C635440|nr:alpha-amylase family protein [Iamia sp. SCSIO 61187]QYG93199.1 trehalose synthase [Iamia sp. SCSIO 61187]